MLLLLLVFIFSIFIVWPFGNFPLNDDWAYSKSVVILTEQHKLDIGEWGAMTLFTHLLWGGLFVKLFGFSFIALRISSLISSFIGILFLYKTLNLLTKNPALSFFGSLCLLFYPIYFNLSNTYMTDVNFNTLLIMATYCAVHYHLYKNRIHFMMVFLISVALVLLRQFGILIPLSFTLSCIFLKQRRMWPLISAVILSVAVYGVFLYYEHFLKNSLSNGAAYKFSGAFNLSDPAFYETLWDRFCMRWKMIVVHLSLFTLPLSFPLLLRLALNAPKRVAIVSVLSSALLANFLFNSINPLQGNIFGSMYLGAETWFESLSDLPPEHAHTWSPAFQKFMEVLRFLAITLCFSSCLLLLYSVFRRRPKRYSIDPTMVFLIIFFTTYIATLLIAESYFDRYHMPLITILLIAGTVKLNNAPKHTLAMPVATLLLILFFYFSVAGTHDYFRLNEVRWEAYLDLKDKQGIDGGTVNAGFEVNCWNDGKPGWWTNILVSEPYTYIIQYRPENQFTTIKKYPFKRLFPPVQDTVRVLKRIETEK